MKKDIHILLVEDDPDDVELLEAAFKDNGIPAGITVISQGDRVLSYLAGLSQLPDVLLLDLNLPKVHGKEILTTVKATDAYKTLPVIILTTSSAQNDIDFCLGAGADYYFTKPTRLNEFQKIVSTVMNTAVNRIG